MRAFWETISFALSVSSSGPSLIDASGAPPFNFGPQKILYIPSDAHFQRTMIVHFYDVSQALHNFYPASFTKACYNSLFQAVGSPTA